MQRDDHPELAHRTLLEQTAEWPSTSRSRYSGAGSRFFSPSGLGLCENSSRREGIERGSRRALAPEFFFRRSSCRGGHGTPPSFPVLTIEADRLKTLLDQGL